MFLQYFNLIILNGILTWTIIALIATVRTIDISSC